MAILAVSSSGHVPFSLPLTEACPSLPASVSEALNHLPSEADLNGSSSFWDGAADRLKAVVTSPMSCISGILGLTFLAARAASLFTQDTAQPHDSLERVAEIRKRAFLNGFSFLGTAINVTSWLHTVELIPLSSIASSCLRGVGGGISLLTSGVGLIEEAMEIGRCNQLFERGLSGFQAKVVGHKRNSAILSLVTHVLTLAWASLTIATLLVTGVPMFLVMLLFLLSFLMALATVGYKIYVSSLERENWSRGLREPLGATFPQKPLDLIAAFDPRSVAVWPT